MTPQQRTAKTAEMVDEIVRRFEAIRGPIPSRALRRMFHRHAERMCDDYLRRLVEFDDPEFLADSIEDGITIAVERLTAGAETATGRA